MSIWYLVHHPDERHYTDAAIAMVQTGDWLTPRCPDGSLRFNKPILAYWCVAASYWALGISPFASRLPFLLAGCGTIWITYQLGKLIGCGEPAGRWAALVAVGNLQIVLASTRSIPDILLCLFTALSCYGLLAIVLFGRRTRLTLAAAHVGLGLAIASKGIPAVVVVGAVAACAIALGRKWTSLRDLVHLPSMILGLLIAGGWFALMYAIHGNLSLKEFAHDQVGIRFEATLGRRIFHFALFVGWCLLIGLPWIVPAAFTAMRRPAFLVAADPRRRKAAMCVLAAVVALAAATSFCNFISSRYVLPVVPLCAAWIGAMLARMQRRPLERLLRWLLPLVCLLLLAVGGTLSAANYQLSHPAIALACALACCGVVAWALARSMWLRLPTAAPDIGLLKLAAFPLVSLGLFHFLLPDDGKVIAEQLRKVSAGHLGLTHKPEVQFIGKPALASKVRVYDRGVLKLNQCQELPSAVRPDVAALLIGEGKNIPAARLPGFQVRRAVGGIGRVNERELLRSLCAGSLAEYLQQRRNVIVLAVRSAGRADERSRRAVDMAEATSPPASDNRSPEVEKTRINPAPFAR